MDKHAEILGEHAKKLSALKSGNTFLIILTITNFVVSVTGVMIGIAVYVDVRQSEGLCDCVEYFSKQLLLSLTTLITEECSCQ